MCIHMYGYVVVKFCIVVLNSTVVEFRCGICVRNLRAEFACMLWNLGTGEICAKFRNFVVLNADQDLQWQKICSGKRSADLQIITSWIAPWIAPWPAPWLAPWLAPWPAPWPVPWPVLWSVPWPEFGGKLINIQ
jgi:hypothetical protein